MPWRSRQKWNFESLPFRDEGHGYDVFGLSPHVLRIAVALARPLHQLYFRVRSYGIEHIPTSGPVIIVANHSGALPTDSLMLCLDILLRTQPSRMPRPIVDRFIPLLPIVSTVFSRIGAVTGTAANVRRLLERGELLVVWPEGTTGIRKPFTERYHLQDWRVGHAELALRHHAPVIPVGIVGAEESWPIVGQARIHPFGAPYVPVPLTPLPFPLRFHITYGEPLTLHAAMPSDDADDPRCVAHAAAETRAAVEEQLRLGLTARGGSLL